jgi:integrase
LKKEHKLPAGIRNRGGQWHWRFKVDGREYSESTDLRATARNLPRASSMLEEAKQLVKSGRAAELKLQTKRFTDAADAFLVWAAGEKASPNTVSRLSDSFASQREFFKRMPLHAITAGNVEEYKSWRRGNGIKEVTLANDIGALSQLLRYGRKLHWCRANPCDEVDKPSRLGARRMFILAPDEERLYFAAALPISQDLFDVGRLMLNQGCRPGELRMLEWSKVDLLAREIDIAVSKTPAGRRKLLLTPESVAILARRYAARQDALKAKTDQLARWAGKHHNKAQGEILKRLRRQVEDWKRYVFVGRGGGPAATFQRAHDRVLRQTGLSFVIYDLRHTFATRMANGDARNDYQPYAALPVLAAIMGHTKIEVTMIYVKRSPEAMRMAMERYGDAAAQEVAA